MKEGLSLTLSQRRSKSSLSRLPQSSSLTKERNNFAGNQKFIRNVGSSQSINSPKRNLRTPSPPRQSPKLQIKAKEMIERKKQNSQRNSVSSLQNEEYCNKSVEIINKRNIGNRSALARQRARSTKNHIEEFQNINQRLLYPNKNVYSKKKQLETKQSYMIQPHSQTINTTYNPTLETLPGEKIQEFNNISKENNVAGKAYLDIYQQSININVQQSQQYENRSQIKINQKANLLRDIAGTNIDKKRSNSPYKLQNSVIVKNPLINNRRYSYQSNIDTIGYATQSTTPTIQSRALTYRGEPNKIILNVNGNISQIKNQQINKLNHIPSQREDRYYQGGKKIIQQKLKNVNDLLPSPIKVSQKENEQPIKLTNPIFIINPVTQLNNN